MLQDVGARIDVETDGRLVQQQQTRLVQQGSRDLHAPHLAARELGDAFVQAVGEIDSRRGRRAVAPSASLAADAMQRRVIDEVLLDRNIDIERSRLEHDAKLPSAAPGSRPIS